MTAREALPRLLRAYGDYYNVETEHPAEPFAAEAVFHSHEEQYFLIRAARIAEAESHEYVFFACEEHLNAERLRELSETAWRRGLERVTPHKDHRNSDVSFIILADTAEPDALALVPKLKYYQSYRFGLHGWSHFLLFATDLSSGRAAWNRQGKRLKDLVLGNIQIQESKGEVQT